MDEKDLRKEVGKLSQEFIPQKRKHADSCGYAKLSGPCLEAYLKEPEVTLGRNLNAINKSNYVHLGENKRISKKQARICWNQEKCMFQIQNLGKNSIIVNKVQINKEEKADLTNKSPIKIGNVCFYFLLPLNRQNISSS